MCGICGIFCSEDRSIQTSTMIYTLFHRGPDGNKTENFPWGSLGFCRLDIFGPSGVNQPAISSDRKTALIFNGEIYNFNELVRSIPSSKKFPDEASLIIELYQTYGESCFSQLKGMFAIAILTPEKIILARDSLGIKPLVYCVQNGALYFASEIKALLKIWDKQIEIDRDALAEASVFGFIFDMEKTMFKGISQVPPGSYLCFNDNKIQIKQFSSLSASYYANEVLDKKDTGDMLSTLLNSASELYLNHSKHSQAIYLSGGIDSTLMAKFLQENHQNKLDTFTLFDEADSKDRQYAAMVSAELGTNHHEFKTNEVECLKYLDHYLYHYESLVTDGIFNVLGSLAFHILSHKIGKRHKVAYCGEGADELFGGYYWMHSHPLGLGDRLRARSASVNNGKTKIHEYIMDKFPDDDAKASDMRKEIFDFLAGPGLTNCHLWSVDRSSAAFSFEARPFYLYDDIRKWALSLSIENKVSTDLKTKLILKNYAVSTGNPVLNEVSARKKIGMPSALNTSLKKLVSHSEMEFKNNQKMNDLPHKEYSEYLNTDLEKLFFDKFYHIFVIDRGKVVPRLNEN
jgi:asparagine synthase (glutamine-hydrolysing)